MKKIISVLSLVAILFSSVAQTPGSKYQSLLWEISGNGLQHPSYLFGTMHVSNKQVFHLSDSFYNALASCSMVSLEVDPKQWQPEMFRVQQSQMAMMSYSARTQNDYMREKSFQINRNYEDNIKMALSEEPMQVNSLLYRSYAGQTDFQENTYLDLYIYQTGRKLGKKATGVENYVESEKLMLEASEDMAKETRKLRINDGENMFEVQKKMQDAYRRGDLDLMDSLSRLMSVSEAYDEKFLYKRNEIQANSIDSIIRKASLFVGVGAAHLPGTRGVIEMLRKKGYTLRPVRMSDQDAEQREKIDKMRVPVVMRSFNTGDGFIQLQAPGPLFKRVESAANDSWQFADMENGSYYMLTRIKTHAGMLGQTEEDVLKRIDSILYESIPGKIVQKTKITKNGYKGFDITNKTRRGDIQRYNVLITPAEVLIFKMSGNDDYVQGKEADDFFNSIRVKEAGNQWTDYTPSYGGFTVGFPQYPATSKQTGLEDRLDTWQYEASDPASGNAYMVIRKSIHNYRFLEEDTLDLKLVEESVKSSDIVSKELSRKLDTNNGYPKLEMTLQLKDGGIIRARAIINGSQYYLLLARGRNENFDAGRFLNSFRFSPFHYEPSISYADSGMHFTVRTPVKPSIDKDLHSYIERSMYNPVLMQQNEVYRANTQTRNATFKSDSTGETIQVSIATLPEYAFTKEPHKFWENEMHWKRLGEDFIVDKKSFTNKADSVTGYTYILLDTNSNRKIKGMVLLKGNTMYKLNALVDNLSPESSFIKDFFASFAPTAISNGYTVFTSKAPLFFERYASSDSLTKKIAQSALSHISFEGADLEKIKQAISNLNPKSRTYIDQKTKLIQSIGRIKDTSLMASRISFLQSSYLNSVDTASLENASILSLAGTHSKEAYTALRTLLTKNPVIFETAAEYNELFAHFRDSLLLAKTLFPGILQLASLEDYKLPINNLLYQLADSGYIKGDDYADHFAAIFFDAQVQLKKLQGRSEREAANLNNDEIIRQFGEMARPTLLNNAADTRLTNYATLLMPFYDKNASVAKFFTKLLESSDLQVKMAASLLLIKNNKPVPDSALTAIAGNERYRVLLYDKLAKLKKEALFPAAYKTQEAMARSVLLNATNYDKFSDIELAGKKYVESKEDKGYVYFIKYKVQKKGDWLMGIAGIQPKDISQVNSNRSLLSATNKKINSSETVEEQFSKKADQLLLAKRKSAAQFYTERGFLFNGNIAF